MSEESKEGISDAAIQAVFELTRNTIAGGGAVVELVRMLGGSDQMAASTMVAIGAMGEKMLLEAGKAEGNTLENLRTIGIEVFNGFEDGFDDLAVNAPGGDA